MAIGAPTAILTANSQASSGGSVSTNVDAPAGSLVVFTPAVYSVQGPFGITSAILSNGDTLTQAAQPTPTATSYNMSLWWAVLAHDLPSGSTITCTTTSGASTWTVGGYSVLGANGGLDATASYSPNGNVGTAASLTTPGLAAPNEIVFAALRYPSGAYTEGAGFTGLYSQSGQLALAYQIVSSQSPVTWAPSWGSASYISAVLASFIATGSTGATKHLLGLMGSGS